ncbi:BTB/POZ domain-containing protein [Aspergillus lucknowensis]|uniref:BTB domain-containing protein n=1 Tax=Aspergillus lucknowensis TaxID=176173 RepID=A0ABR4M4T4_9EURO
MVKKKKVRKTLQSPMPKIDEPDPPSSDGPDREAHESILDLISRHYLNSDYSDLVIVCKGKALPAHKLVVCPRSEYFKSACLGGFKEAKEPIRLDNTDPVLIEKVLEFLYTGNYTIGHFMSDGGLELDTKHAEESLMNCTLGEHSPTETAPEAGEATDETTTPSLDNIAQVLVDEKDPSNQDGGVDAIVGTSADCHPSYFHLRIFGQADYFMISDLKDRAKEQFRASFMDCSDRYMFAEVIKELYSNRANYQEIRKVAIDVVVDNLPNLRKGFIPAIDSELVKAVPDFAIDLCLATLDKYASEPTNMKPYPFATGFEYKGPQPFGATNWSYQN